MSIAKTLLRAARIQEQIERLRGQLSDLLDQARAEISSGAAEETSVKTRRGRPKRAGSVRGGGGKAAVGRAGRVATADKAKKTVRARKRGRRPSLAGQARSASPTGPLAPAVVKVLQGKKQPMNVRDILAGLLANGYQFNSPEPRKNLAARIYRLPGVKQVDAGLFGLA